MNFLKHIAQEWNAGDTFDKGFAFMMTSLLLAVIILLVWVTKGILLLIAIAMYVLYKAVNKFFQSFETEE